MDPNNAIHVFTQEMVDEEWEDRDIDRTSIDEILVTARAKFEEGGSTDSLIGLFEEAMEVLMVSKFMWRKEGPDHSFIQECIDIITAFALKVPQCCGHPNVSGTNKPCQGLAVGAIVAGSQDGEEGNQVFVVCEKEVRLSLGGGIEPISFWMSRDAGALNTLAIAATSLTGVFDLQSEETTREYESYLKDITTKERAGDVESDDSDEVLRLQALLRDAEIKSKMHQKMAEVLARENKRLRDKGPATQRQSPPRRRRDTDSGGEAKGATPEPVLSGPQQQQINSIMGIETCPASMATFWTKLTHQEKMTLVGAGDGVELQASDLYGKKDLETYADSGRTIVKSLNEFMHLCMRRYGTREMVRGQSRAFKIAYSMCHGLRTALFDILHNRSTQVMYHGVYDKNDKEMRGTRGTYPSELSETKKYQRGVVMLDDLSKIATKEAAAYKERLSFPAGMNYYDLMGFLFLQWKGELEYNIITCPRGAYRHLFLRRLVDFERGCHSVEEFVAYVDGFIQGRTDSRFPSDRLHALSFSTLKGFGPAASEFLIGNTNTLPVIDPEHRIGHDDPPVPLSDAEAAQCKAAVFSDPVFVEMLNLMGPALKATPSTRQRDQAVSAVSKMKSLCDTAISTMAKGSGRD